MSSMSITPIGRKAPHCKKCHKPLKGHRRGVCDNIEANIAFSTYVTEQPSKSRTRRKSAPVNRTAPIPLSDTPRQHKSAPLPQSTLLDNGTQPSLSPQSSEILHNLFLENSFSGSATTSPRRSPSKFVHFGQVEEIEIEKLLPDALKKLSVRDEVAGADSGVTQLKAECEPLVKSEAPTDSVSSEESLVAFLKSMSQNSQYPLATMFSFPFTDLTMLQSVVSSQKLHICILTLPETDLEENKSNTEAEWVPVVIGKTMSAITNLLEEGEKFTSALKAGSNKEKTPVAKVNLGLSHVAVGTLGALATWAGLAYS